MRGLLALDDPANTDGVPSAAASVAIEQLLERELRQPEPGEDACRRHYAAHLDRHRQGDRIRLRQATRLFDADAALQRDDLLTLKASDVRASRVFGQAAS